MKYDYSSLDLAGKSIFVTGATGSFGQSFVRTVLHQFQPRRLIIFSRDEQKQYEMGLRLSQAEFPAVRYFIGDVRDVHRLELAMRDVEVVVHAAALKHVPTAEYNPFECVQTNIHGAENVVKAALTNNVEKVIALSTDKAVNPINLYGASKLAADKIFVAANNLAGTGRTRFSVVRYGNVMGSRGSVVPLFQRLIRQGADELPITDPNMTRFWITLEEGVEFVLSCLEMMHGGEIFVPKIPSMRIVDLAKAMAPGLAHRVVGIRPGEKLHEALLTDHDSRTALELENLYVIEPAFAFWNRENYLASGAKSVEPGFVYQSDTNTEWLDDEAVDRIIRGLDHDGRCQ